MVLKVVGWLVAIAALSALAVGVVSLLPGVEPTGARWAIWIVAFVLGFGACELWRRRRGS